MNHQFEVCGQGSLEIITHVIEIGRAGNPRLTVTQVGQAQCRQDERSIEPVGHGILCGVEAFLHHQGAEGSHEMRSATHVIGVGAVDNSRDQGIRDIQAVILGSSLDDFRIVLD